MLAQETSSYAEKEVALQQGKHLTVEVHLIDLGSTSRLDYGSTFIVQEANDTLSTMERKVM